MKNLSTLFALCAVTATIACSSSPSDTTDGSDGATGGAATGGAATGGAATGGAATGGAATGGAATGGAGTGGSNPNAVTLTCMDHTYTAASSSTGSGCSTVEVPGGAGINDFETTDKATWMRHYLQGSPAGTITDPSSFTDGDAAGVNRVTSTAANGTTASIHYAGSGWVGTGADGDDGIRVSSSFATCQDVRTYSGVSFWAKGTTAASTDWGGIAANTVILFLSDGTTNIDTRVALTGGDTWTEYRVPFNCVGDTSMPSKFEGYVKSFDIQIHAPTFDIALDEVSFY